MTDRLLLLAIFLSFFGFVCSASSSVSPVYGSVHVPTNEIEILFVADK